LRVSLLLQASPKGGQSLYDGGMKDRFEPFSGDIIPKHEGSQGVAVDSPTRPKHALPKLPGHLLSDGR
jgi:hypothetical protein